MTNPDTDQALQESLHLIEEANNRGVPLRLTGGAATEYHNHSKKLGQLEPEKNGLKDVDMVTYKSNRVEISKIFSDEGYIADRYIMAYFGEERFVFHHPTNKYLIDIFFENLNFNHPISLRPKGAQPRIELDYPTLTIADLLLSKLQIHQPTQKDLRDLQILILEHSLTDTEKSESINTSRITSVLADDWGFYHDAKTSLLKIITNTAATEIKTIKELEEKVAQITSKIDSAPKSVKWQKRERQGTKKQWWNDVEELVR
jgi:hypothetical protein